MAVAFFKSSDVERSGLKSLTDAAQILPFFKGFDQCWVPHPLRRPPLVLLLISSGLSADTGPGNTS